jgi:hypothetical protein
MVATFLNIKKIALHMPMKIQVVTWDRHKHVVGLKGFMGSNPPLDNWISNDNMDNKIQYKT